MSFEEMLEEILKSEGGYNPSDGTAPDGSRIPSYAGVLQTTYDWFLELRGGSLINPPGAVRELANREDIIKAFYRWWIWERSGAADVPEWFAYMLADWYVQSGGHAIKPLQQRAECDVDGAWGPNTKRAVGQMFEALAGEIASDPHADNDFVRWYDNERRDFMKRVLPDNLIKGVLARCDKVLRITLEKVEKNDTLSQPKTIDLEMEAVRLPFRSRKIKDVMRSAGQPEKSAEPDEGSRFDRLEKLLGAILEKL